MATTDSSNNINDKPEVTYRSFLQIITGPMFSGKTTYLVNLYNNYNLGANNSVVAINYVNDKRYSDTMISTHDKLEIPCIFAEKLGDILTDESVQKANVILINEGQFFPDLVETVLDLVENQNKIVHVCGLDGDFKRQKFGTLLDLIPYCNNIVKLNANCANTLENGNICKKIALFSHRITEETSQVVIGSTNYMPLCRNCYIAKIV